LQERQDVLANNILQLERQVFLDKVVCLLDHSVVIVSCESDRLQLPFVVSQLRIKLRMVQLLLLQVVDLGSVTVDHIETLLNAFLSAI
jgi:hypothetical protein